MKDENKLVQYTVEKDSTDLIYIGNRKRRSSAIPIIIVAVVIIGTIIAFLWKKDLFEIPFFDDPDNTNTGSFHLRFS